MSPFPYNDPRNAVFKSSSYNNPAAQQVVGQSKQIAVPAPLTIFQMNVSGPTLIRFDGFFAAANNADIGSWSFWANLPNGVQGEFSSFEAIGNYLYLPTAGQYRIGLKQMDATAPGVTLLNYTVFEDIDPFLAALYVNCPFPTTSQSGGQVFASGVGAVIGTGANDPASTIVRDENNNVITHGKQLRLWYAHITNTGANAISIAVGTDATAGFGEVVPANGVYELPPGAVRNAALYGFSAAGTTLNYVLSYQ